MLSEDYFRSRFVPLFEQIQNTTKLETLDGMDTDLTPVHSHHDLDNTSSQEGRDMEKAGRTHSGMSRSVDDHDETATAAHEKSDVAGPSAAVLSPGSSNEPRKFSHGCK